MKLDPKLRELMKELGAAINESLGESERIAAAIENIKTAGYDVFLVLEATIGFNKREEATPVIGSAQFTAQDQKSLHDLGIALPPDEEQGVK